jgi:outer membrane protein OmpA-like peptidoglycan-associated protein
VALEVFSLEKGCIVAGAYEPVGSRGVEGAVVGAMAKLLVQLVAPYQGPVEGRGPGTPPAPPGGPRISGGEVAAAAGRVILKATPPETRVAVSGPGGFRDQGGAAWERADLAPGSYRLEISAPGHQAETREVALAADDAQVVKVTLRRLGTLEVRGTPAGARVDLTGPGGLAATKGLPVTVADAPSGTYRVRVSREGYAPVEREATVRPGETAVVEVALGREGPGATPPAGAGIPPGGRCEPGDVDAAKERFVAGTSAFKAGRFQEAADAFLGSWTRCGKPALLMNLGQVYLKLGDRARARRYFERYLAEAPPGEGRDTATLVIAELDRQGAAAPSPAVPAPAVPGLRVAEQVHFARGSAAVPPEAAPILGEVAATLRRHPALRVRVEGHADTEEGLPRPTALKRAAEVRTALVALGVAAERLEAAGSGIDRPVAPNITAAGRARNRRVEFTVIGGP